MSQPKNTPYQNFSVPQPTNLERPTPLLSGSYRRSQQPNQTGIFNTPNLQQQVQSRTQPQSKKRGLTDLQNDQQSLRDKAKIQSDFELNKIYRPDYDFARAEEEQYFFDQRERQPQARSFRQFMDSQMAQTQPSTQNNSMYAENYQENQCSFLNKLSESGTVLGKQRREFRKDAVESLEQKQQAFAQMQKKDNAKVFTDQALELLDEIDPQTSLKSGSVLAQIYNRKSVQTQYLFHPYLLYKAGFVRIEKHKEAKKDSYTFGGFFPASLGISVAYMVSGNIVKVWNTHRGEATSASMIFDQAITAVVLIPPDPKTIKSNDPNCKRLFRLLVHTCIQTEKVYLQAEPFKLLPSEQCDQPLVLLNPTNDCVFLQTHQRVWMGSDTTQELLLEEKPSNLFSARRKMMKLNKPTPIQSTGQKILTTAISLFTRQRHEVKTLHELPQLGLTAAIMQELGDERPTTMIEFYDIQTLTLSYRMKLEKVLRLADNFLAMHKAQGNVRIGRINVKSKKICFLTLSEQMYAVDNQVAKLPYLNLILTNGVKIKFYIAPTTQSSNQSRFITDDDIQLIAIDSSPIETALESFFFPQNDYQGPLITTLQNLSPFLPFQVDCNLVNLKILDYKSHRYTEIYVVECDQRLFMVSLLETTSRQKISSVRILEGRNDLQRFGYLGLNLQITQDSSMLISVLMQDGIISFKQQTMKDQIGQYLFIESNSERLNPIAKQQFKSHISQFFNQQNDYDLLSYLLTLIVFTHSTHIQDMNESLDLPAQNQSQIYGDLDLNKDKKHRNACIIQQSSHVTTYYQKPKFDFAFDSSYLNQNEGNERCTPLKMDEDMQKIAIAYFIDTVTYLQKRDETESNNKGIVAEILMIQLRKVVGPILSYLPFTSNQAHKLGPSKLANVISVFQNLSKFLPKLVKVDSEEITQILNLTNRIIQALNLYLVINKSFGIELNLEKLKKESFDQIMINELECMSFRDYFERGIQSPELCQLIEAFLTGMHSLESKRKNSRQSFLTINSRLFHEINSKCCDQFLNTEILNIVHGRYLFNVASNLLQKQKQLYAVTQKELEYDPLKPQAPFTFEKLLRDRDYISHGLSEKELQDQRMKALNGGFKLIMDHIMQTDLKTTIYELLRNFAVEMSIDYCLTKAKYIKTKQEYLVTRPGNSAQRQQLQQELEIIRQDCFTIVLELFEESLLRIASLTQKLDSHQIISKIKIEAETISNRLQTASHFEGVNQFRKQISESDDLQTVQKIKTRISEIILETHEKQLHFEMFRLLIEYSETSEFETCKSIYLEEFIQKNIIDLNIKQDEEGSQEEQIDQQNIVKFESNLIAVYKKLTVFNQHEQCLKFLLTQLTDKAWYKDGPENARSFGINERVEWLMKAKVCLMKAQPSPFIHQCSDMLQRLIQHLQTQTIVLTKIHKMIDKMTEEEIFKQFSHFLNKMTFGICSNSLLMLVCQENKLWSSQFRVVNLMVNDKNQVQSDNDISNDQLVGQRQLRATELQKLVDTAMVEYVRSKYIYAQGSNRMNKFMESLKRKQGVYMVQQGSETGMGVLKDVESKFSVDLFPVEVLISEIFLIDQERLEKDQNLEKAFLKEMSISQNRLNVQQARYERQGLFPRDWLAKMLFESCFTQMRKSDILTSSEDGRIQAKEIYKISKIIDAFITVLDQVPRIRILVFTLRPSINKILSQKGSRQLAGHVIKLQNSIDKWFIANESYLSHPKETVEFAENFISEIKNYVSKA